MKRTKPLTAENKAMSEYSLQCEVLSVTALGILGTQTQSCLALLTGLNGTVLETSYNSCHFCQERMPMSVCGVHFQFVCLLFTFFMDV